MIGVAFMAFIVGTLALCGYSAYLDWLSIEQRRRRRHAQYVARLRATKPKP